MAHVCLVLVKQSEPQFKHYQTGRDHFCAVQSRVGQKRGKICTIQVPIQFAAGRRAPKSSLTCPAKRNSMLRLYLSCAPADRPYLDTLLRWVRPLQEKYFLRVWHPPVQISGTNMPYHWDSMLENLEQAHLYLFLTSPNALSAGHLERDELPRAMARQAAEGGRLVRIYQVPIAPLKAASPLTALTPVGGPRPLADWKTDDMGYRLLTRQLEQIILDLRRNWLEEHYRLGLPVEAFTRPELPPPAGPVLKPIPGWAGLVLLFIIFYMVTSWYLSGCAPRMYHHYVPESLPYQALPERYFRENPVEPPQEVPERPE